MGTEISVGFAKVKFKAVDPTDADKICDFLRLNDIKQIAAFVEENEEIQDILGNVPVPESNAELTEFNSSLSP